MSKTRMSDYIKYVVTSNVNIIIMPTGPDDECSEETYEAESQKLANDAGKPVWLMYHNKPVKQFDPK